MSIDWISLWCGKLASALKSRNYSKETEKNYLHAVKRILSVHPGNPRAWTKNLVQGFLLDIRQKDGFSPSTVNLYRDGIGFFCRHVRASLGPEPCLWLRFPSQRSGCA